MTDTFVKGGSQLNQFGDQFAVINRGAQLSGPASLLWMAAAGAPTDGTTGLNTAGKGSLYTNLTTGDLYLQTGLISSPVWKLVTHA